MNDRIPGNRLFKQKRIRFLGEVVDAFFTALPLLSVYSGLSVTIIMYESIKGYILNWLPWMTIIHFVAILGVLFIPVILFTYKFIIPSIWHFRSTQMSYLDKKVDEITQRQDEISKKLDELLKEKDANSGSK